LIERAHVTIGIRLAFGELIADNRRIDNGSDRRRFRRVGQRPAARSGAAV
jgi:hypothetical protein